MLTQSPIPLYYQVANVLRHRILDGAYHPGERLGSESDMCDQFGVSRITIRQALSELGREELVVRRRGRGTYVAMNLPHMTSVSFTGFLEDLFAHVLLTEPRDIQLEQVPAGEEVAQALQLRDQDLVVRIARVRLMAGSPLAHTVSYLPVSIGAAITVQDLQELPLLHVLQHRVGVRLEEAIQTVRAVVATPALAAGLATDEGAPLLLVQRTMYSGGRPVEYVLTHFRADRYQYTARLLRITRNER